MAKVPPVPPSLQSLITGDQFRTMAGKDGRLSAKETRGLLPPPPKGYKYTYQHSSPNAPLVLKKDSGLGKTLGKIGLIAGGVAATALTGGAASPLLAAAIGAGTGAGVGAIDGGWKGAGIGALTGGATGGLLSGAGGAAGSAVKQGAGQAVKSAFLNPQTIASIGGQAVPGKAGTLLSMIGGAGGGNMASNAIGWGNLLKGLAKDPSTYSTIASMAGRASEGQAKERTLENQQRNDTFGTQQNTEVQLLQLLENAKRDRSDRAMLAPKERARQSLLGSLMQNYQPMSVSGLPSSIVIPKTSGGMGNAINAGARAGGGELQRQALLALLKGSDVPELPDTAGARLTPAPYQGAGGMETAGSLMGLLGASAEAIASRRRKVQEQAEPSTPYAANVGANRNPYSGISFGA